MVGMNNHAPMRDQCSTITRPDFRYHGGKFRLAAVILLRRYGYAVAAKAVHS